MKKVLKIISISLVVLFLVLSMAEVIVWRIENKELQKANAFPDGVKQIPFHSGIKKVNYDFKTLGLKDGWGRAPEGLKFKKKKPVVLFGCSYAYGYGLEDNQTFAHKLALRAKRTVYNRSFPAWGIQHMLYQAQQPSLYEKIPEPGYVIYVYMHDHLRRLYLYSFASWNILNEEFDIRYKDKNGELFEMKNSNPLLNQVKRLYTANSLQHWYVQKFLLKDKERTYDLALEHFIAAKDEMQKHWKKTKFVILIYDDFNFNPDLKSELKQNGFIVMDISEFAAASKFITNKNPNEAAWNAIVPKVVKELKL